jgi:hypothetical protein
MNISSNQVATFQKGFQTLNQNLVRSNALLTQRLNQQQIDIDLLQEQVDQLEPTSTTEFIAISKTALKLENVDNTSDENKPVSNKTQQALDKKHPLIEDADSKRLSQTHVQGLVTDLANKHPLIHENAKLSKGLVSNYNFSDIRTSTTDDTRLSVAMVNIPSSSIITSATGVTPKVTLDTTLGTFHPKLENATNKRLAQNLVEGLVSDLAGKHPTINSNSKLQTDFIQQLYIADIKKQSGQATTLQDELNAKHPSITSSAKLDKALVSQYYFNDIQTSSSNSTTLTTALTQIPSTSIITSAPGVTPVVTLNTTLSSLNATVGTPTIYIGGNSGATTWSNLNYTIGSIISVQIAATNIISSNQFTVNLLNTLPSGTWSGCVQFIFTKTGTNYSFATSNPIRLQIQLAGTKASNDFFPGENNHQANYITNANTQGWQMNLPVLFRCAAGRDSNQLQALLTVPNTPSTTNPVPTSGYLTYAMTLSMTKIAL